jgi:uncharacterized damage-inducible protein DinB
LSGSACPSTPWPRIRRWADGWPPCRMLGCARFRSSRLSPPTEWTGSRRGGGNSIGTLLYHVALIEADWLFEEILGGEGPAWPKDLFPFDVREVDGTLTPVRGLTMDDHLRRLEAVRQLLLGHVGAMSSADLHRVRALEPYDVAPDWVLHHLMQHEAEHRAQMAWLRTAAAE